MPDRKSRIIPIRCLNPYLAEGKADSPEILYSAVRFLRSLLSFAVKRKHGFKGESALPSAEYDFNGESVLNANEESKMSD